MEKIDPFDLIADSVARALFLLNTCDTFLASWCNLLFTGLAHAVGPVNKGNQQSLSRGGELSGRIGETHITLTDAPVNRRKWSQSERGCKILQTPMTLLLPYSFE